MKNYVYNYITIYTVCVLLKCNRNAIKYILGENKLHFNNCITVLLTKIGQIRVT